MQLRKVAAPIRLCYSALLQPTDVSVLSCDFVSMLTVYLVYAFSSVLAFDPWHMITSFLPYVFLSPTYINILNMCVMNNHRSIR
jgi:cellulose synthase/poly-beta-1,6-N-acetylglucosamine synthase-like glycosyltransferase